MIARRHARHAYPAPSPAEEAPAARRVRLLRKAAARWRRRREHEDRVESVLRARLEEGGRVARNARRGLERRGFEV